MSPAAVEVIDRGSLPDQVEHRASLLLRVYAEPGDAAVNAYVPKRPKHSREPWFVVDANWFNKLKLGDKTGQSRPEEWFRCSDPGRLDNSKLMDNTNPKRLRERLIEGIDYFTVNEAFWRNIQSWYNVGGPEIVRFTLSDGTIEMYPPTFKVNFTRNSDSNEWDTTTEIEMEFTGDTTVEEVYNAVEQRIGLSGVTIKHQSLYKDFALVPRDGDSGKITLKAMQWTPNSRLLVVVPTRSESIDLSGSGVEAAAALRKGLSLIPSLVSSSSSNNLAGNRGDNSGTSKRRDGLCGLSNLGNTCYMNAVLQCLSHTGPLRAQLLSGEAEKRVNLDSKLGRKGEVVKEMTSLVREMWNGKHKTVSPNGFKAALDKWTSWFRGYSQQDAHEFLAFLLDAIHEDTNFGSAQGKASVIDSIFKGMFHSTLTCSVCGHQSTTSEGFHVVSLELPSSSMNATSAALTSNQIRPLVFVSLRGETKILDVEISKEGGRASVISQLIKRLGVKGIILAMVRDDTNSSDMKNLKLVGANQSMTSQEGWSLVAYESETEVPPDATIVHGVKRVNGSLVGLPFAIALSPSDSRRTLVARIRSRMGLNDDQDAGMVVRTVMSMKITDAGHELAVDESKLPLTLAFSVFVADFSYSVTDVWETRTAIILPIVKTMIEDAAKGKADELESDTLLSRLNAFCAPETLDGDEMWLCEKCAKKQVAVKRISFDKAMPDVLALHLKRFDSHGAKLSQSVNYAPAMEVNGTRYDLYGIIRHHGSTITLGHYDAIARSSIDRKWYRFNDSYVSVLPDVTVGGITLPQMSWSDPSAYLFFYRKSQATIPVAAL